VTTKVMTPELKERYDRQIRLPSVTESGQQKFLDARVLIIGMGGLAESGLCKTIHRLPKP